MDGIATSIRRQPEAVMSYFRRQTPDPSIWIRRETELYHIIAAMVAGLAISRKEFLRFVHQYYAHLQLFPIGIEHGEYGLSTDLEEWIKWLGYDDLNIRETCARMLWGDLSFNDFIRYLYKFKFRRIDRSFPVFIQQPLTDREASEIQRITQVGVVEAQRIMLVMRDPIELAFEFELALRARRSLLCSEKLELLFADPRSEAVDRVRTVTAFSKHEMLCKAYFRSCVTPGELERFRGIGLNVIDWEIYKLNNTSDEKVPLGFTPNVDVQCARGNTIDSLIQGSVFAMLKLTWDLKNDGVDVTCMVDAIHDNMDCVLANDRPRVFQTLSEITGPC